MTETDLPSHTPKKAKWRSPILGIFAVVASLTPLATNSGCTAPSTTTPGTGGSTSQPIVCGAGQIDCGSGCVDTTSNASNCGTCGKQCDAAAPFCSASVCSATCTGALEPCGNACVNKQTSTANCGACGTQCTNNMACFSGVCACPADKDCSGDVPVVGAGGAGSGGGGGLGTGGVPPLGIGGTGTGGVGPATGGGPPTGGGGSGGTGTGTGGGPSEPLGGYHLAGDWAGFAFTFVDTAKVASITPEGFDEMLDADGPYCVSGSVPNTEEYSAIAAFGVNVNQQKIEDAPVGTVASTGDGIMVDVTINSGVETLRVQLEDGTDPEAADSDLHRWCSNITGTGTHPLGWADFSTQCWCEGSTEGDCAANEIFDGRAIAKIIVYVPDAGPDGDAQNFDFCINDVGPTNIESRGTGELVASCGNSSSLSGSISDQYANVMSSDNKYGFQSNGWGWGEAGGGSHAFNLLSGIGYKMTTQSCNSSNSAPCSFPSVYIGQPNGGTASSGNGLPAQVSGISSIPTCLGWSSGGTPASDEYNVSYDVWFNSNAGADHAEKFLMVWFRDPPSFQPGGSEPKGTSVIGDQSWRVWFGPNADGQDVVSYVAPNGRADGQAYSFDLKDFIDDALERGYLESNLYLTAVMAGMEVWGGGQGASIDGFRAEVQ